MVDELTGYALIAAMALITYLTRVGGLWIMGFVSLTPRVEATLKALSGSVLVALVVPAAIHGGSAHVAAASIAALFAFLTGKPMLALCLGVAVAALGRAALPGVA